MSFDRRSFRIGVLAGVLLLVGLLAGTVMTVRLNLSDAVETKPVILVQETAAPMGNTVNGLPNFVPIVKRVRPAVVNISTTRVIKKQQRQIPFIDPRFRDFFGEEFFRRFESPRKRRESSLGSGVILDPNGYIVTNNHVIAKADKIKVVLSDKREFIGKVIGTDPKTDLAVIKINAKKLPYIPLGDSDQLQVGEYVLAIGSPYGLKQTVTMGIVSAVGRSNVGIAAYEDFIQTDAAINPGNSGGALVNARGQLIGINTAIFSRSGGNTGIGFAVPANMARYVVNNLIKSGKVVRGWLGVAIQPVDRELAKQFGLKNAKGALVSDVIAGTPASKARLRSGDIIISFDGKTVDNPTTLRTIVAKTAVAKTVKVRIIRNRKSMVITVVTGEQPKRLTRAGLTPKEKQAESTALSGLEVRNLTPSLRDRLGLSPDIRGVVITRVEAGSVAESKRLRPGDVIIRINRQRVRNLTDFNRITARLKKRDSVLLYINRAGNKSFVVLNP